MTDTKRLLTDEIKNGFKQFGLYFKESYETQTGAIIAIYTDKKGTAQMQLRIDEEK